MLRHYLIDSIIPYSGELLLILNSVITVDGFRERILKICTNFSDKLSCQLNIIYCVPDNFKCVYNINYLCVNKYILLKFILKDSVTICSENKYSTDVNVYKTTLDEFIRKLGNFAFYDTDINVDLDENDDDEFLDFGYFEIEPYLLDIFIFMDDLNAFKANKIDCYADVDLTKRQDLTFREWYMYLLAYSFHFDHSATTYIWSKIVRDSRSGIPSFEQHYFKTHIESDLLEIVYNFLCSDD